MLVHFKYYGSETARCTLNNLESLVSANICIDAFATNEIRENDATPVFRGISNLLLTCEDVPDFSNVDQLKKQNDYSKNIDSGLESSLSSYHFLGKRLTDLLIEIHQARNLPFFEEIMHYLDDNVHSALLSEVKEIGILGLQNNK
ncbi:hypothetical protein PTKIN_Ptkin15bG0085100 [Pterospermum kingtungense]